MSVRLTLFSLLVFFLGCADTTQCVHCKEDDVRKGATTCKHCGKDPYGHSDTLTQKQEASGKRMQDAAEDLSFKGWVFPASKPHADTEPSKKYKILLVIYYILFILAVVALLASLDDADAAGVLILFIVLACVARYQMNEWVDSEPIEPIASIPTPINPTDPAPLGKQDIEVIQPLVLTVPFPKSVQFKKPVTNKNKANLNLQPVSTLKIDYVPSANAQGLATIPAPKVLSAHPVEAKVLPGRKSTDPGDSHKAHTDGINDADRIGSLGIASLWCQNSYYNDGKYNDNNWKVVRGVLKANAMELDAYTIHPADHNATDFLASKHALFYRFKDKQDHVIYELDIIGVKPVAKIAAREVKPNQFVRLGALLCNRYSKPRTFVIVPASISLTTLHTIGEKVAGGMFGKTAMGHHVKLVFSVNDTPYDTQITYTAGPADWENRYGQNRRFFPVSDAGQAGVIWQAPANGKLYVSWFAKNFDSIRTTLLPHDEKAALASATSDGKGTLFYVMIAETSKVPAGTRDVRLYRTDRDGSKHQVKAQDAKKNDGGGLNVWKFGTAKNMDNDSALQYSDGKLGMILARRMHLSDDGLNHQGAIAVVFDAEKLTVIKNHGQTSGHSFETFLTIAQDSRFLGVDLGDNYPRGVNLHRFDSKKLLSRVVHTYKTKHGEEAKNPAGKIFQPFNQPLARKRLFQWSNDNNNYTEIGGVVESTEGFAVIFSSENHELDNAKAVSEHNGPRNLGLVLVRKDFENAAKGKSSGVVTDDLVLSKGDVVTGGYYSFGGEWMPQRTAGVRWLTGYSSKSKNASRVKVAPHADGEIAVFWEQWSGTSYKNTFGMVINANGTIAVQPVSLGNKLRLGRRDDPFVHDNKIIHVSGNETSKTLTLDIFIAP